MKEDYSKLKWINPGGEKHLKRGIAGYYITRK